MAILTSVLVSLAISVAISVAMRVVSSLLAPHNNAQSVGGQLQSSDGGTQVTVRNPDQPHQIVFGRRRVQGNIVFAHVTDNNSILHLVVVWAGHEVDGYEDLYFNDERIELSAGRPTGRFFEFCSVFDHLGAADQAADGNLIANAPDKWTADHRGRGVAYSYFGLRWNRDAFPQGLPNIWRVVRGMKLFDPRDATTVWSNNAALAVAAWMNSDKYGRAVPYGGANGLDTDALSAAANVCDEDVPLAAGGTEKRYTANGVLQSDQPFVDNLTKLLSASHGTAAPIGGQWVIDAAAWEAPVLVLAEKDFRAPFTLTNGIGNGDAFNAIKGTFVNPAKLWNTDDFPAILAPAYEIEDGGDGLGAGREFKDVRLDFTDSAPMAQRIARVDLRQARQPISFTAQVKLVGLKLRAGNTVAVSVDYLGWVEKAFKVNRVKMVLGFAPGAGKDSQPGIVGVDLDLRETAAEIYDWDATLDEIAHDAAPNTTLPDPFNVLPPANLTAVWSLYDTRSGGGVKARVTLAWDASPDAFVQSGGWYVAEYKLTADTVWAKLPQTQAATIAIPDIAPGAYDFRVTAFQWTGAAAATKPTIVGQYIAGLSAPPSPPVNFTVAAMESFALARADAPLDLDVQQGGFAVFKHAPALSGVTWATALTLCDPLPAFAGAWPLPLKAGTYLVDFYDSTGNPSGAPASFVVRQSSAHTFTPLAGGLLTQNPAFAGVKTNTGVVAGGLTLAGAGLISAVPSIAALRSIAYWGGVHLSGTYDFAGVMDLGAVKAHRLTDTVTAQILAVLDRIGLRTELVSTWPRIGSAAQGDEADSYLMVASTDDDPAGSPAWTAYQRLDAATFTCRAHKFRRVLESTDSSFSPSITADSVVAEGV